MAFFFRQTLGAQMRQAQLVFQTLRPYGCQPVTALGQRWDEWSEPLCRGTLGPPWDRARPGGSGLPARAEGRSPAHPDWSDLGRRRAPLPETAASEKQSVEPRRQMCPTGLFWLTADLGIGVLSQTSAFCFLWLPACFFSGRSLSPHENVWGCQHKIRFKVLATSQAEIRLESQDVGVCSVRSGSTHWNESCLCSLLEMGRHINHKASDETHMS